MLQTNFTMRQLLEAGVHYGHHTRRWNPKMAPFIFGVRNNIHIINLEETVPLMYQALSIIKDTVAAGGRILFVGTKRQASEKIAEAAKRCGQYYVNHRWLGGMMTNWKTVSNSIKRLKEYTEMLEKAGLTYTKKEILELTRKKNNLERSLGGIKELGGVPDLLFIIDTNKETIAIQEANKIGIPIVAVLDTNSDPDGIDYPIPGNDDALRAINIYCDLVSSAILEGLQMQMVKAGVDLGEKAESDFVSPAEISSMDSDEEKEFESSEDFSSQEPPLTVA